MSGVLPRPAYPTGDDDRPETMARIPVERHRWHLRTQARNAAYWEAKNAARLAAVAETANALWHGHAFGETPKEREGKGLAPLGRLSDQDEAVRLHYEAEAAKALARDAR